MKKICILCATLFFVLSALAQVERSYALINPASIEAKNYYFTSLLEHFPELDSLLTNHSTLKGIALQKQEQLQHAQTTKERIEAMKFSAEEIERIGTALSELYRKGNSLEQLMVKHILPSGCYQQYTGTETERLKQLWEQDACGMNKAIDIYAAGHQPNYPQIDSIGFDKDSPRFTKEILPACQQNICLWNSRQPRFYSIPLKAVSTLLDVNDRRQAIDYEPLAEGENKASYEQIAHTEWNRFPYSAILVLGAGPGEANVSISPEGKLRAAYAALLYRQHKAPFIILSGGRVHPYHTPYNEAYEMKKYLMDVWQVPQNALIIEPHARHTTTNVRNAGRILLRQGFPIDKYALITSSESHIDNVTNDLFAKRCTRELKHVPYRLGKRISDRAVEFYPQINALTINPSEPMDP